MKNIFISGVVNDIGGVGEMIRYHRPVQVVDTALIKKVETMLENEETLKVWNANDMKPYIEIVDHTGEDIHILHGLNYVDSVVEELFVYVKLISDVNGDEVDEEYHDDIYSMVDNKDYRKAYSSGVVLEIVSIINTNTFSLIEVRFT